MKTRRRPPTRPPERGRPPQDGGPAEAVFQLNDTGRRRVDQNLIDKRARQLAA